MAEGVLGLSGTMHAPYFVLEIDLLLRGQRSVRILSYKVNGGAGAGEYRPLQTFQITHRSIALGVHL